MDPRVWIFPAPSPVKHASPVVVPTKLRTTVADSSVSTVPEIPARRWKRQRNVQAVLGLQVGDLVGGGSLTFEKAVQWLGLSLSLEPSISKSISNSRSRIESRVQSEIHQDLHAGVCSRMEPVDAPKHVKDDLDAPLEANVHSQFRSGVGAMPNRCQISAGFVSMPSSFVWLTAADAAWANRPDGSSTSVHVIMAAHPNIPHDESSTVSVLVWNSRKIRRVVRSSLGAECAAFSTGLEHTEKCRVLHGDLCGDLCDLAEHETYLHMTDACA